MSTAAAKTRPRGLGSHDLVSREEVRAVLRCSRRKAAMLLERIPSVKVGKTELWRWGRVLETLERTPELPKRTIISHLPRIDI